MSETPLPEGIPLDDIGDDYVIVPYALQFGDEDQPMPAGCIVANLVDMELTGYVLGANGEWSQTNQEDLSNESEVFGNTPDQIYQSFLVVAGDDWNKLSKIKDKISDFLEVESQIESSLVNLAEDFQTDSYSMEFCSCDRREEFEDTLFELSEKSVSVGVCSNCGGLISVEGMDSGKKQFSIDSENELYNVDTVDADMDASSMTLTDTDDLYMYTQSGSILNNVTGVGIASWWQSQRVNPSSQSFVPTENNITLICRDDSIVGVLLWSYLFNNIVTVRHANLFDISDEELEEVVGCLSEEENSKIYIKKPYKETALDKFVTPFEFVTGSVQMASKSGE